LLISDYTTSDDTGRIAVEFFDGSARTIWKLLMMCDGGQRESCRQV
jgi:hypothetical protein